MKLVSISWRRIRSRSSVLLLALSCLSGASSGQTNERVALVIGNSDYRSAAPLRNPRNDANAMAALLRDAGFQVDKQLDADLPEMQMAVDRFGKALRDPQVKFGLFYYAGHGFQLDSRNYLVPVNYPMPVSPSSLPQQTVDVSRLLQYMKQAQGRNFLVILDACRDDPFAGAYRPPAKGLTQFDAPVGSLLAYATAPGRVSSDGQGKNGLYTGYLLRELSVRSARLEDAFKRVRLNVRLASNGAQVPWESSSLEEDIYLFPHLARHLSEAEKDQLLDDEMKSWMRVRTSADPEVLADFIRQYPSSSASELAQSRMNRMLAAMAAQEDQRLQIAQQNAAQAALEVAAAEEAARRRAAQAEEKRLAAERAEQERVRIAQLEAARVEALRRQKDREAVMLIEAARLAKEKAQAAEQEAQRVAAAQQEESRQAALRAQAAALELERMLALQRQKEAQERELARQAELARVEKVRLAEMLQLEAARLAAEKQSAELQEAQRQQIARAQEQRLAAQRVEQERLRLAQIDAERQEARRQQMQREVAARAEAARIANVKALADEREAQRVADVEIQAARMNQMQVEAAMLELQRLKELQAENERQERALAMRAEQARLEIARMAAALQQEAMRLAVEKQNLLNAVIIPSAPISLKPTPFFHGYDEHRRHYDVGDEFNIRVIDLYSKKSEPLVMKVTGVDDAAERVTYNNGEFVSDLMGNTTTNQRGLFSTPRQFYPAELMVGKRWSTRFKQSRPSGLTYTFQYDLKVVAKERITVPAGTFDAYKIEARGFNIELGAYLERNIWVAPGVNADIAHEIKVRLRNGRMEQNDRQELVSFVQTKQ